MRKRGTVIVYLVVAACSAPVRPAATDTSAEAQRGAPPSPAGASLIERLRAEAGDAPSVLAVTPTGLRVTSSSGASRTLVAGAIAAAGWQQRDDLVWLIRGGKLEVLDLRSSEAEPVAIIDDMPDERFIVTRHDGKMGTLSVGNNRSNVHLVLRWNDEPTLSVETDIEDLASEEQLAAAREAKLVGGAWLKEQLARPQRSDTLAAVGFGKDRLTALDYGKLGDCDDPEECGHYLDFGSSPWKLVQTTATCGDWCYTGCRLFDPASGTFAKPEDAGNKSITWQTADEAAAGDGDGTCGPFLFARDNTHFALGNKLCAVAGGCLDLGGAAIGFVVPGPIVGLDY